MREAQCGAQAQRCRESPCCACGARPTEARPNHPHHWPTTANGGLDRDTCSLCPDCHDLFHSECGSPEEFMRQTGCDIEREIKRMRGEAVPHVDHDCEAYPVPKVNRFALLSYYVCGRCGNAIDPNELNGP